MCEESCPKVEENTGWLLIGTQKKAMDAVVLHQLSVFSWDLFATDRIENQQILNQDTVSVVARRISLESNTLVDLSPGHK